MRPAILFPLFKPLSSLRGVGPRLAPLYARLCGEYVVNLLWHLPTAVVDRSYSPRLREAEPGRIATLTLTIIEHLPPRTRKLPYRILATDGSERIDRVTINYFNAKGDYLTQIYPLDRKVIVSGVLDRYHGGWSMSHPDYVVPEERKSDLPLYEQVYPLTDGVSGKILRKIITQALSKLPNLSEWHDPHLLKREHWTDWKNAILTVHNSKPVVVDNDSGIKSHFQIEELSRRRLSYDELLADQLALALIRKHHKKAAGRELKGTRLLQDRLVSTLPFKLTNGQWQSISEISADLAAPKRMLRLLQGDVGSGKTIVALMAMLQAVESRVQAALMAPTEILAKQHHAKLTLFLRPLGIEVGLVVGKSRGVKREEVLRALASGQMQIVVGTHALFQDDVVFQNLGLAVVDEQHRFGVSQRLKLSEKGRGVDILVMTATPIPRTLTLTAYGDMDVSRLSDKPHGRLPIDTRLIDMARLDEIIEGVRRQIETGVQVYWVCPLIEQSELVDLAAATDRANLLAERLGVSHVGLLHGQMKMEAKDRVMAGFIAGDIKVLVATTVIEVGVDVPNASLMIIEHAERFGLAQLHQLRGRVGRGSKQSNCLLVYHSPLGEIAKHRLRMMRETGDGFKIAEEDLRLRGPGELLGTRQSGLPEFHLADLTKDQDLLELAHKEAELILVKDPDLSSPRGDALRNLLYLFEQDAAVPRLRSG